MKTAKALLLILGVANTLFALFHGWLGWLLHHLQAPADIRALLEMLNGGGLLLILFLIIAAFAFPHALLTTTLGRTVLVLGASLYLLRGLAEIVVSPKPKPVILAVCVLTGALYVSALLFARRAPAALESA